METKKWEAMLTAVELGSFTRAAERLGLTQSGLTHMMNALEKEVGFPLLLRDRYGVRPTAAGERLLPAVQELMEANRRLEGQIAAQNNQKRENIRVAAYSSICMHWLPTIIQQFRWACPDVSVDIRMGSVAEIFRWLQEGKVDLSFASRPDIRSNTAVEDAAILSMVEHGLGVSVLSQLVLQGRHDNVRALPLDPPASRHIGIAVPSLEEASPIIRQFIEFSQRIVGALHGGRGE